MNTIHHPDLLREIETYIARTGMGETYFGKKAINNSELISRLRNGGRVWPETAAQVRAFMKKNPPDLSASSGPMSSPEQRPSAEAS